MNVILTQFEKLSFYFSFYPSVRYAAVALLLISVCSALIGVVLVLKRLSMIGDGLSHVTFGATAVATALGILTPIYVALPVTVIASVLLVGTSERARVRGDAAIAVISAGALAFGYLALNIFSPEYAADACDNLFGTGIISIDLSDVIVCSVLAVAVTAVFVLLYNRIFATTFDESFAIASGMKVKLYHAVLSVVVGVTVVIAMNIVGALLISALVIFPALSAMRVFRTFRSVTVCAAVISAVCSVTGLLIALITTAPVGSTVVIVNIFVFLVFFAVGTVKNRA